MGMQDLNAKNSVTQNPLPGMLADLRGLNLETRKVLDDISSKLDNIHIFNDNPPLPTGPGLAKVPGEKSSFVIQMIDEINICRANLSRLRDISTHLDTIV